MKNSILLALFLIQFMIHAQEIPTIDDQIKMAVLAAPADVKEGALVYGYNAKHELTVLRQGKNDLICLGDDPAVKGINVSCYHKDLEPFMARRRTLKAEGKNNNELFQIGEEEVKNGKLMMPKNPTTLFVFTADEWDATTGVTKNSYVRSVIYIPFATAESTGLPLKPSAPGMPWIMDPGTHRAHIMINPAPAAKAN